MSSTKEQKADFLTRYFRNQELSHLKWAEQEKLDLNKVIVQIPARSQSSRLRDKNILKICGMPLLAYTAMIAKRLSGVDRVVINTDSSEYAAIAESYGVEVPFLRPSELAADNSSLSWATYYLVRHCVDTNYPVRAIITMMPTSPFRNLNKIQHLVDQMLLHGAAYSVFCANALVSSYFDDTGRKILGSHHKLVRGVPVKTLGNFIGEFMIKKWITSCFVISIDDLIEMIDIDKKEDFDLARFVIENGLFDFGVKDANIYTCNS